MSLPMRTRISSPSAPEIALPPPFRLVTLREVGDAFAHAQANAAKDGAGTLVYVGRFDLVEFALVLEPDEPLQTARRTLYAGMNALADALAVHAPPEKPIRFDAGRGPSMAGWSAGDASPGPSARLKTRRRRGGLRRHHSPRGDDGRRGRA